jgi:hypothetical protein
MTDRTNAFDVLAAVSAAMLVEHHPADVLARLTADCLGPLSADSAAVLVVEPGGGLGLLTASSHRAAEIEMLQSQQLRGPCIDAVRSAESVRAVGGQELVERWGDVGEAIRDAGFESVHAFPMRWHGRVLVQVSDVSADQLADRVHQAMTARSTVERAKGVLAYQRGTDPEAAYEELVRRAAAAGGSVAETALQVVRDQYT